MILMAGAWGDKDIKEQLHFEAIDLSKSFPNLRTVPLILTPPPDIRPQSATPVLRRKNKVIPIADDTSVHEDEVSFSSRAVSPGKCLNSVRRIFLYVDLYSLGCLLLVSTELPEIIQ